MINIKNIAEGLINETFTNENLQSTYGGKLELTHAEELFAPKDRATKRILLCKQCYSKQVIMLPSLPLELYF